ncbi:TolC family protein [Methylolobus aquaticus]
MRERASNGLAALTLGAAIAGCAAWNAPIDPVLDRTVRDRLDQSEGMPVFKWTKRKPETVEESLKRMKEETPDGLPPTSPPPKPGGEARQSPERTRQLTIADVRGAALHNNLDLEIAKVDPAMAATFVTEEEGRFNELIFARAKYTRKDTPPNNMEVVQFQTPNQNEPIDSQIAKLTEIAQLTDLLELDAGVTIPLRTGGTVTLSTPLDEKEMYRGVPSNQYRSALRFSISQPLLRAAGVDANVAPIRIARYEQQVVDVKTRLQAIRILATIDRAYWAVYQAWGELDVRRQQYEYASNNLAMVKRRVAEGLVAAIESKRAEVGVTERMESVIVAETSLKLRQRQLKLLMNDANLKMDSATILVPTTRPTLVSFDFDRDQLVKQAQAQRLELLELELKLAADLTKVDYLRNQTLPLFMLDYSYASLGRNTNSFEGAIGQAFSGDFSDWSVGLRMEYPIGNEQRLARLERAVNERLQRLTTRQLRELTVQREIYDALDTLQQNWQRIVAARQNVLVAGINYDAELKQFNEGLRTMTEVLETLTRLGDAQVREIRAVTDYQIALIDLSFATGTLLGYSRVDFEGIPRTPSREIRTD